MVKAGQALAFEHFHLNLVVLLSLNLLSTFLELPFPESSDHFCQIYFGCAEQPGVLQVVPSQTYTLFGPGGTRGAVRPMGIP